MSDESAGLTRRDVIKAGTAATLAGYAVGVEKALGQAIKTDTDGLVAGDAEVAIGSYNMPVYEARPASGGPAPIVVCVSEIWGVHEWVRDMTRRFAKAGYYAVAPDDRMMLLAEFTAHVYRRVHVGESCTVVGWELGANGRKREAGTALFDGKGQLCGKARALWIEPRATATVSEIPAAPRG